jgi:uncharacterized protein (TIGR02246 family)
MKNLMVFFWGVVFLALISCSGSADVGVEEGKIQAVLDQYVESVNALDPEFYLGIYAHDDDMVIYHAIPNVRYIGFQELKEAIEEGLPQYDSAYVSYRDVRIKIHNSGKVAWLTCYLDTDFVYQGEHSRSEGTRVTMILEKRNNIWLVVHVHASFAT